MKTTDETMDDESAQRQEWRRLAAAHNLQPVAEAEPGADFARRVMASVRADRARRARLARRLRWAAAAAAVLAAVILPGAVRRAGEGTLSQSAPEPAAFSAEAALDDLVARQRPDGSWSSREIGANDSFTPALTALAAIALERHASAGRAEAVERAVRALEAMQRPDGSFGGESGLARLYNHAFATFALLDHDRRAGAEPSDAAGRAVAFAVSRQNAHGAWDYPGGGDGDAALTLWQLGLLATARECGWRDDQGAFRRGLAWLRRAADGGVLDYREALDRPNAPLSGGIVLTQLSTEAVASALDRYAGSEAAVANLKVSLDVARGRHDLLRLGEAAGRGDAVCRTFLEGDNLYPTILALISVAEVTR